ncbi:MAG: ATP-binding cassette domain-containing protein [Planctomycetaceae bacterium]|nr:ATP-binding cassette domain-containing protein [Planctomycetaceae bacterium]
MTQTPVISFDQVSRRFGSQEVLRNVSLEIHRNETLVVIGESGCGKSVSMKLMMSLMEPSSGQVLWAGRPLKDRTEQELLRERLRFGYLFQGAALFDSLSVFENVAFGLRQNTRMNERQIHENVRERVHEVGLPASVCSKKPAELSGGMKKRVGLARALALQPEVVFYDEPTTGLDPVMTDVINELILKVRSQRPVTSVVVTHEMRTVQRVADRVLMFYPVSRLEPEEDQIIFTGTAEEAFASADPRVAQFVAGVAGDRLQELAGA